MKHPSETLTLRVILVVLGLSIGVLLSVQFSSPVPVSSTFAYDQVQTQKELLKGFLDEQGLLQSKIVSLRVKVEELQKKYERFQDRGSLDTLAELKGKIGLTKYVEKGVEVILNDGKNADRDDESTIASSLIHAADLRDVVNVLRSAGAKMISINGQRVVASTPITSVGNSILVNNFHLAPPYSIAVLGDPETLSIRLNDPLALPDLLRRVEKQHIQFSVSPKESITIPLYNGELATKYLQKKGAK